MKIYTKGGDKGQTSLFSGQRVSKATLRVAAYGDLDELNAHLGALRDHLIGELHEADAMLFRQQKNLFVAGSILADDREGSDKMQLAEDTTARLEQAMDDMTAQLPELRHFILPGGHPAVSAAHLCRTVCRRAERMVVALAEDDEVPESLLVYLNRLSDYFFVLGRWIAHRLGVEEIKWEP